MNDKRFFYLSQLLMKSKQCTSLYNETKIQKKAKHLPTFFHKEVDRDYYLSTRLTTIWFRMKYIEWWKRNKWENGKYIFDTVGQAFTNSLRNIPQPRVVANEEFNLFKCWGEDWKYGVRIFWKVLHTKTFKNFLRNIF